MPQENPIENAIPSHEPEKAELHARLELIREFRRESVARNDPLLANLSVLAADLMTFSAKLKDSVESKLDQSNADPVAYREFERRSEMYLKFSRQIDRLSRIVRESSAND